MTLGNTAFAAQLCNEIQAVALLSHSNFYVRTGTETITRAPEPLTGAERCTLTQTLSGARAFHCAWKYPLRAPASNAAFNAFNETISACLIGSTEAFEDRGVNHPDSYRQHKHTTQDLVVSVSIKDKSALQATYVFVAITSTFDR